MIELNTFHIREYFQNDDLTDFTDMCSNLLEGLDRQARLAK